MTTTPLENTLAAIDRWFEQHPVPSKKPAAKPQRKSAPAQRPDQYWLPDAVIMWESEWQCTCGCQGPATPQLFIRERMGKSLRLRAISSPNQYGLLPRFREQALPSHVRSCPNCFAGQSEYIEQQLILPFPEELAKFKRRIVDALDLADMIDSMLEQVEEKPLPRNVRCAHETPLPKDWEFMPLDIEFTGSAVGSDHYNIYHHSVASDVGPALPYCWREEH